MMSTIIRYTRRITDLILLAALCSAPGVAWSADSPRNFSFFYERAFRAKPNIHETGERIRIAKGLDPDRIIEFTGMHDAVAMPGDTDEGADDFREDAYNQLRAEIRMAYAELASTRGQIGAVRQTAELVRQMVEAVTALYAGGKADQAQALKTQIEWERWSDTLQSLEKREKVFSIRLNVLTGDLPVEEVIPPVEPLREYAPAFNSLEVSRAYKSRRFLAVFQQLLTASQVTGDELHGADSLDTESEAFVSVARLSLENLSQRIIRYRTVLIPRAEQAHAARREGYRNGRVDVSALLEGLRDLSDLRREYQALLGEIHVLKARVEYLTGVTLL